MTGDGDVAASAGAAFVMEEQPLPVTLMANLGGVDREKAIARLGNWGNLRKRSSRKRSQAGDLDFDLEVHSKYFAPGVFAADLCHPGEINLWPGSMFGVDGLDRGKLTRAEIVTRDHAMRLVSYLKRTLPGFETSWLEYTANQIGVRETRRIVGGWLADAARSAFDGVPAPTSSRSHTPGGAQCAFCTGRWCLRRSTASWSPAGACRPSRTRWSSALIPVCLATGQAAGTAAALAVRDGVSPRDLDVAQIQRSLLGQGMELGLPAGLAGDPASKAARERG